MDAELSEKGIEDWKRVTHQHIIDYWNDDNIEVGCEVEFERQGFNEQQELARVRRNLQSNENNLTIYYRVRYIWYRILDSTVSAPTSLETSSIVQDPFSNLKLRNNYISKLSNADPAIFGSVEIVTDVRVTLTIPQATDTNLFGMPRETVYTLAGCLVAAAMLFFGIGFLMFLKRNKKRDNQVLGGGLVYEDEGDHTAESSPPPPPPLRASTVSSGTRSVEYQYGIAGLGSYNPNHNDDVSTLADPAPQLGVMSGNDSIAEYNDESIATVDYDYSKAYGGLGGNSIISATEGTLGSGGPHTLGGLTGTSGYQSQAGASLLTPPHLSASASSDADQEAVMQHQRQHQAQPHISSRTTPHQHPNLTQSRQNKDLNLDDNSIFTDDPSYVQGGNVANVIKPTHLIGGQAPHQHGRNQPIQEESIDIFAPAGKLGVVIDTPDDGAPVVHAIKDSSVVANKLRVGDKLIAVDDEDVRAMTAIKVSKMISKKSSNASRKLTILRSSLLE